MKLERAQNVNTEGYWNKRYEQIVREPPPIMSVENFFRFGFLPQDKPIKVLDIGCGTATHYPYIHKRYPQVQLVGADISSFAVNYNKTLYKFASFLRLNIETDPLPEVYDYIISAHTFEHLTDPLAATEKCIAASRAHTIICVPYKESWSYDHEHMHTFSEFEPYTKHDYYLVEYDVPNKVGGIYFRFKGTAK